MAEHTVVILGGGTGAWPRPGGCAICWMRPTRVVLVDRS